MDKCEKKLYVDIKKRTGRSGSGAIAVYNRGGGVRYKYKGLGFNLVVEGMPGKVLKIFKVRERSGFIGLVCFTSGIVGYVVVGEKVKVGDYIVTYDGINYSNKIKFNGSAFNIGDLSVGEKVFNIGNNKYGGSKYVCSAGNYGIIRKKFKEMGAVLVKFRSGKFKVFLNNTKCFVGVVSNVGHFSDYLYKAGQNRHLGSRPHVRGVAMNPVDHPLGGGEGKSSGGRLPVSPWGKLTKGKKIGSKQKRRMKLKGVK